MNKCWDDAFFFLDTEQALIKLELIEFNIKNE